MSQDVEIDPDPQLLLPEELRAKWAVGPKTSLYQIFLVGAVLGAGLALSIVGIAQGPEFLKGSFPIALALCYLQNKVYSRIENRRLRDLESLLPKEGG